MNKLTSGGVCSYTNDPARGLENCQAGECSKNAALPTMAAIVCQFLLRVKTGPSDERYVDFFRRQQSFRKATVTSAFCQKRKS
jgi:hypothetical protein